MPSQPNRAYLYARGQERPLPPRQRKKKAPRREAAGHSSAKHPAVKARREHPKQKKGSKFDDSK